MPRAKVVTPVAGIYKNGRLWWKRTVHAPISGATKRRESLGTDEVARANSVAAMADTFAQNPKQYEWLDLALAGEVSLDQLYTHHAAGTLHLLKAQLETAAVSDLDPLVESWATKYLTGQSLESDTRDEYVRMVRALIPAGKRFPAPDFTTDKLSETMQALTGARHDKAKPLSDTTRRHYVAAWQLFYQYARTRVANLPNPFDDTAWIPEMGDPRTQSWPFATVQAVLGKMTGMEQVGMTLILATGMELGALQRLQRHHLGTFAPDINDDERTIVAPGTKNGERVDRTIFVDAWAWPAVRAYADGMAPMTRLFPYDGEGDALREAFYAAQVAAGLIIAPPVNPVTRKKLWGRVAPHWIHDARHTFCEVRGLGLDGEEPRDLTYLAHQLGHADEQMVMRIYKKKNMKQRFDDIQRKKAVDQARAERHTGGHTA